MKHANSRQFTNLCARSVLALLFVFAAVAKLADLNQFAQRVGDFGLVFDAMMTPTAWAIVLAELLVGISLVLQLRHSLTAAAALLLLLIGVLTYGMAIGLDLECGCFGSAVDVRLGTQLLTDLGLLLLCAIIYGSEKRNPHPFRSRRSSNSRH